MTILNDEVNKKDQCLCVFGQNELSCETTMTMERPRYDTEALVDDIRKERRNKLIIGSLAALAIVAGFLYMLSGIGSVPKDVGAAPTPTQGDAAAPSAEAPGADEAAEVVLPTEVEKEKAPEPPATSKVSIKLPKRAMLWLDGQKYARAQAQNIEVSAGEHTIKIKQGRRIAQQTHTFEAGKEYRLKFVAKRKKILISEK